MTKKFDTLQTKLLQYVAVALIAMGVWNVQRLIERVDILAVEFNQVRRDTDERFGAILLQMEKNNHETSKHFQKQLDEMKEIREANKGKAIDYINRMNTALEILKEAFKNHSHRGEK